MTFSWLQNQSIHPVIFRYQRNISRATATCFDHLLNFISRPQRTCYYHHDDYVLVGNLNDALWRPCCDGKAVWSIVKDWHHNWFRASLFNISLIYHLKLAKWFVNLVSKLHINHYLMSPKWGSMLPSFTASEGPASWNWWQALLWGFEKKSALHILQG